MSMNRRYFVKGLVGSGLISLSTISIKPHIETVENRILRLFTNCSTSATLYSLSQNEPLRLRETNRYLLNLSDKAFIKAIDKNIRLDFNQGYIISLAGWQLARTEITIINMIGNGAEKEKQYT